MVDGLHASEIGGAGVLPYTGDETEVYAGDRYEYEKTFRFIKHGSVIEPGSIRIAGEFKSEAGSYDVVININGTAAGSFVGKSTDYTLDYIDIGLGAISEGVGSASMKMQCVYDPPLVSSFASPGPEPSDLAWDGYYLWNGDTGVGYIFKLKTDGTTVSSFASPSPAPTGAPTGLTWDGYYLWEAEDTVDYIIKLKTDGTTVSSFASPDMSPRGLAWDGYYLWNATSTGLDYIFKLKTDGTPVSSFIAPLDSPDGLTWDGYYLWEAESAGYIFKLKTDGTVISSFASPGTWARGLTWDGYYLWHSDSDADYIFKLNKSKRAYNRLFDVYLIV